MKSEAPGEQTRRNRVTAARRAAAVTKAMRARREGADGGGDHELGPHGTVRGSAPVIFDFRQVLERVKAAAERARP